MTSHAAGTARSYLYVPGNRSDRLSGATQRGADAVILDLEDAVPVAEKDAARRTVSEWLAEQGQQGGPPCEVWIRINSGSLELDVSVVDPAVAGIVLPKAEPMRLRDADRLLGDRERNLDLHVGHFKVLALVEIAIGLLAAAELARGPRIAHLGIGEADLAAELRLRPSASREELTALRLQLVVASVAAGIGAPVGPTSTDFRDLDSLRLSTQALLRIGFRARTAIHPAQVPIINEVFSPTADEVAEAGELVAAFEAAERTGSGAVTDAAGRMVDVAVIRSAREVLARAGSS